MNSTNYELDLIVGDDVTPIQEEFINHWSQFYFGGVAVSRGLAQAPVHWRLILRQGDKLLSQVGLTKLDIEIDGQLQTAGGTVDYLPRHIFRKMDMGTHCLIRLKSSSSAS